jgi:hypothetical protein
MTKNYFFHTDPIFGVLIVVIEDDTIGWTTEENTDYLAWVADGNTAEEWQPEQETN